MPRCFYLVDVIYKHQPLNGDFHVGVIEAICKQLALPRCSVAGICSCFASPQNVLQIYGPASGRWRMMYFGKIFTQSFDI